MKISKRSWLLWLIATSFFSFQFILRLFPGLIMSDIMTKFKVNAMDFGILSAAYYFGYAGMQIPIGILLDRYSPRNVISVCALVCSAGIFSFVYSTQWSLVVFGRFLIGAGSAAGFLGTTKIIRTFFPESRFTSMVGMSFSLGLLGALYGGKPITLLIEQMGWTHVLILLAWICLIIAVVVYLTFPQFSQAKQDSSSLQNKPNSAATSVRELFSNHRLIWIALSGAVMVGPLEGFADVWGISYLSTVHGYTKSHASLITSSIYCGMLLGGPILSFFADKYRAFYTIPALCGLLMALCFGLLLLASDALPSEALMVIMSFVGILCCYQVIVIGLASQVVPSHLTGLATSFANCMNMLAGSFFHLVMGSIMDLKWSGTLVDGIKLYDKQSYISAIMIIPIMLILGFIGFTLLRTQAGQKS